MQLGIVRGISYGLFKEPDEFVSQARALGAGLVRAYIYWSQVEPRPGEYDFHVLDALLGQRADADIWLTVCSSSLWATREPSDFLPPSPAKDPGRYREFVRRLVEHAQGRVGYWQCDNEPSNVGLTWAGTAEEYVAQLTEFHAAVKEADPHASVVLGGCGYDVLSSPPGSAPREFFAHLADAGRDAFDLFDVHLYGDPAAIPSYVDEARKMMRANGYAKPVVAGEFAGPVLFEFPEIEPVLQQTMMAAFAEQPPATQSVDELQQRVAQDNPERRALVSLYERAGELPDRLRMFLDGCPPELEARRHRANQRQLVQRAVLALAAGVELAAYWNLAPEVPGEMEPYQMMHLLFGKLVLLEYEGTKLTRRRPAADTFALVTTELAGATKATKQGERYVFTVERDGRPPLLVLWDHRDAFDGEDQPPVPVSVAWSTEGATAVDAFGAPHEVEVDGGTLRLLLTDTPVLVTPTE
jgi:hypothetical protein